MASLRHALRPSASLPLPAGRLRKPLRARASAPARPPGERGHTAIPLLDCAGLAARRRAYPRIKATARRGARTENAKVRNRRLQKKFNGKATKPRLSVFFYVVLADDHNKKILFYGITARQSICGNPPCTTVEAARRIGEELIRVCTELGITEISSYDRNGFARGEKMMAFEIAVSQHGFLPRQM